MHFNVPGPNWVVAVAEDGVAAEFLLRPQLDTPLQLPEGSALAIFATGRTAGWIAHALEQHHEGHLIRPRAIYAGPMPAAG